jgi:hypothetical protein
MRIPCETERSLGEHGGYAGIPAGEVRACFRHSALRARAQCHTDDIREAGYVDTAISLFR